MSYDNANRKKMLFAPRYGNRSRNWNALDYFLSVSNANSTTTLRTPENGDANLGDGTFLFAPGKKRPIQINYFPIQCNVIGNCDAGLCDNPDVVYGPAQQDFEITQCTASQKIGISLENIRQIDFETWDIDGVALESITAMMPQLRKEVAIDWLTYAYLKAGVHSDGNPVKRITPSTSTDGAVNALGGRIQIDKEYGDAGMEDPYIIGGGDVYYWKELVRLGGQQATGIRTDKINTSNVWYDQNLASGILDDQANGGWLLAIDPRMFKLITYSENAGLFKTDMAAITDMDRLFKGSMGQGFILGTYLDRVTNLVWDLYINFDKCAAWNDGKPGWTAQLKLQWDMLIMPPVACNIEGYNGLTKWRTCPEVIANCPTGTTPSPAVTPTARSWTPSDVTLNIYESLIGGIATTQNNGPAVTANIAQLAAYMNDATGNQFNFYVVGGTIRYLGVTNISVNINNGEVTGTFA